MKKLYICSKHFSTEETSSKKLSRNALPVKYVSSPSSSESHNTDRENTPPLMIATTSTSKYHGLKRKRQCNKSSSESDHSEKEWLKEIQNLSFKAKKSSVAPVQEIEKLKLELTNARKKVNNLQTQLSSAKKKILRIQHSTRRFFGQEEQTVFSKNFLNMQLRRRTTTTPWTPLEKKTALAIYYKSSSCYSFLRRKGLVLPAISTIKKWLGNFLCTPGFNKRMFKNLAIKAESLSKAETICIVMFDEMSIKRHLDYSEKLDIFEGIADLGNLGRTPVPASQALVIMIRGIYSAWKIPLAYFLTGNGITSTELHEILLTCLEKLTSIKLRPIGIVCDLSSTNQKVLANLNVTLEKPYFMFQDQKYYAFYDVPHLLKCIRNNFLNNSFVSGNKLIKFSDIKAIYELDSKSNTGRCLLKLSNKHVNPNAFEKMNVKLAAQLLSHSVASAIKVALQTGELVSATGEHTANFVDTMNYLFDALNSTRFTANNPYNRVLSEKNPQVMKAIDRGYDLIKNLYKINTKGELYRPPSFDGFLQTINAVKMFYCQQLEEEKSFLFTGRLSQDPLENQFSIYRQKGGYNRNPTAKSFRMIFKLNLVTNLMKPASSSNSGTNADEDENLLDADGTYTSDLLKTESGNVTDTDSVGTSSSEDSDGPNMNNCLEIPVTLEVCSTVYFAGYLVKKCFDKFKCLECSEYLESPENIENSKELLIFYKNYDLEQKNNLKTPTELMASFVTISLDQFSKNIIKYISKKVMFHLMKVIKKELNKMLPAWFNAPLKCKNHRHYILHLLIKTLIFKYCKTFSNSIKTQSGKKNIKLSILHHN